MFESFDCLHQGHGGVSSGGLTPPDIPRAHKKLVSGLQEHSYISHRWLQLGALLNHEGPGRHKTHSLAPSFSLIQGTQGSAHSQLVGPGWAGGHLLISCSSRWHPVSWPFSQSSIYSRRPPFTHPPNRYLLRAYYVPDTDFTLETKQMVTREAQDPCNLPGWCWAGFPGVLGPGD